MSTRLDHSPADLIRYLIVSLGRGTLPVSPPGSNGAWPVMATSELTLPDDTITCYDVPGRDNGRTHAGGRRSELRGVQVRVRSSLHKTGYVKANNIAIDFDEAVYEYPLTIPNPDGDDYRYVIRSIKRTGDIIALGKSDSKRSVFTINVLVTLRQLSDTESFPGGYLLVESGSPIPLSRFSSKKISELNPLSAGDVAGDDVMPIADISEDETKKIAFEDLQAAGGDGSDLSYVHNQLSPSATWTAVHNLNKYPSVTVVDSSGDVCIGSINYTSANQVVITFRSAFSGKAYLN